MANQTQPEPKDTTMEKAVWGFVGTSLLWISLIFSGLALERLGVTSWILPGILPGETGALRTQGEECQSNLSSLTLERDVLKRTEDTLRTRIKELESRASTAAP